MQNLINQSKYDFLGPVVLTFILLVGIGIGFLNGIRTAAFFFILNIFTFVGSVLMFHFSDEIIKLFPQSYKIGKIEIKDIISNEKIRAALISLLIIIFYLFMNIFVYVPIYFFFRKKLKSEIFRNKKMGKSNVVNRTLGIVFGFFISIPIAIIVGNMGSSFGIHNDFYGFINKMSDFVFFGVVNNINDGIQELIKIA